MRRLLICIIYSAFKMHYLDKNNNFDHIDHLFVEECIKQEAYGLHLLFEKMYLHPKRIISTHRTRLTFSFTV